MRALVYRGPHDIGVEDRPDPQPGPDEVLLRITATGICGSDLHGYTGENKRRHPGQVMGHETVGRIVAVGLVAPGEGRESGRLATVNPVIGCGECARRARPEPSSLCPRRTVIGVDKEISSAFAELMLAPARNIVVLPDDLPEEYGALIEPLAVGYHAARNGRVGSRDAVLVIGGGPIGQAATLAARRLDAERIVVSEPSAARRALVEKLGFATIDPTAHDLSAQVQAVLGGPATAVLDAVGIGRTVGDGLRSSALGARLVLVGMGAGELTLAAFDVSTFERSIIGSFTYPSNDFRETASGSPRARTGCSTSSTTASGWTVPRTPSPGSPPATSTPARSWCSRPGWRATGTMSTPRIRNVRASVVRGGGADYHDQEAGHWIDDHISTPMAKYPQYRQSRQSFGINVLGTLVVEVEADDGTTGFAVTTGGELGAGSSRSTSRASSRGAVTDIEKIWDQMYLSTLYYGRKGIVLNTISGVDLALWDLLGQVRQSRSTTCSAARSATS